MTSVPWIQLFTSWPRHRKTIALRRELGSADYILSLWCWCAENAPDGDLSGLSDDDIEYAADWRGERGKFVDSAVKVGFLDDSGGKRTLHGWMERSGAGVESLRVSMEGSRVRAALRRDADLMRLVKERDGSMCRYCGIEVDWKNHRGQSGGTYDHVIPICAGGRNSVENVVVACRSCNSRKCGRLLNESGMKLLDVTGKSTVAIQSERRGEERKREDLRSEDTPLPPNGGKATRKSIQTTPGFERFWQVYPADRRNQSREWAMRKWPGDILTDVIVAHVEAMIESGFTYGLGRYLKERLWETMVPKREDHQGEAPRRDFRVGAVRAEDCHHTDKTGEVDL